MPTFHELDGVLTVVPPTEFDTERTLQRLIEQNLEVTFGCRFVATEFSTGLAHGGRIDTLAISEEGNPVIIEYKKVANQNQVTQALYYLDWIKDHHGDFEVAVQKALGAVEVNWSAIRVICIAPNFDTYSSHAVKHMGVGIELWRYKRFSNGTLELEELHRSGTDKTRSKAIAGASEPGEVVNDEPQHTIADHLKKGSEATVDLFEQLQASIEQIDASINVVPQKLYIAYKLARNLVCVEIQKKKLIATLNRKAFERMPANFHDMTNKGHWGTGDVEVHISNPEELSLAVQGIKETYNLIGGS